MAARWGRGPRSLIVAALCLLLAACGTAAGETDRSLERAPVRAAPTAQELALPRAPLVGAHYYHWYPSNWSHGTLRTQLDPPQQPELGLYDSTDPAVAEQHIAWASAHGIDFFTLDWWPVAHQENQTAIPAFLRARNLADIDFTIFYETWNLSFDPALGYADLDEPGVRQAFLDDMAQLADTYFDHPSYLRVDGRPVVILYLTRVLVGDVAGAMAEAREMWRARGHDPYVIADEVFWNVTADRRPAAFTTRPQESRIRLFDAITSYNPYESGRPTHAGYGAESQFVPDVNGLYQRYRDATGGEVPIIPGVLAGYNDRGVRPRLDHYVIPRAWAPGAPEGTFLAEMLRQVADRWLDPRNPMVMITSWNEWNEDTGIEPLAAAEPTAADTAADGISRTNGVTYGGVGTRYLEVVRDHYVAVAGQVVARDGAPIVGTVVTAWRDGAAVAQDTTDSRGRYTLPRAHVGEAPVVVVAEGAEMTATLDPTRTVEVTLTAR